MFLSRLLENSLSTWVRVTDRLCLPVMQCWWKMAIAPFTYLVGFVQWTPLKYSPGFTDKTLTFQEGRAFLVRARVKLRANLTSRVFLYHKMCQSQEGEGVLKGEGPNKFLIYYHFCLSLLPTPIAERTNPFLLKYLFILGVLHLWWAGGIWEMVERCSLGTRALALVCAFWTQKEASCWLSWQDLDFILFKC